MMGYNDWGEFINMADSFNGRKLRPLVPRPSSNHHMIAVGEQSKRQQLNTQQVLVSARWNPTPEQLQILEELYRCGTRTPSTHHIQHITAQLRRFGKIEGKNVFYWFQNHKARERQKRRRHLESTANQLFHTHIKDMDHIKESGPRTDFEVEQTKKLATPTNCSFLAERSASIQGGQDCSPDLWIQLDKGKSQHANTRNWAERNDTWHMRQLSSSTLASLINSTAATTPATVRTMDPKVINAQDQSIFVGPCREDVNNLINVDDKVACEEYQTLQLFPLRSDENDNENGLEKTPELSSVANTTNFTPFEFFEFLPLKS